MSSRGKTVTGTDGTDHTFRERIADQYKISAKNKSKLKLIYALQIIPLTIVFAHLFQNDWGIKLTNHILPKPRTWEYLYMISFFINIIGFSALAKNNVIKIYIYIWGTVLIGFGSVAWGGLVHYPELANLIRKGENRSYFFGYPLIAAIYVLLAISAELHILGLTYSLNLANAWKPKKKQN